MPNGAALAENGLPAADPTEAEKPSAAGAGEKPNWNVDTEGAVEGAVTGAMAVTKGLPAFEATKGLCAGWLTPGAEGGAPKVKPSVVGPAVELGRKAGAKAPKVGIAVEPGFRKDEESPK